MHKPRFLRYHHIVRLRQERIIAAVFGSVLHLLHRALDDFGNAENMQILIVMVSFGVSLWLSGSSTKYMDFESACLCVVAVTIVTDLETSLLQSDSTECSASLSTRTLQQFYSHWYTSRYQ